MPTPIVDRIVTQSGVPELLELLAERLAPTDLQSLLLEVYRRRAEAVTPARLLAQYESNRLVRPSSVSPTALLEFDRLAFALAVPGFEPLELAPVCPLACNSAVATVDQNQTLATVRNSELVSDLTNVLALECAVRRRAALRNRGSGEQRVQLCASHRLLRPQTSPGPSTFSHFRLFGLCSADRAAGSFAFETSALLEHVAVYVQVLQATILAVRPLVRLRVSLTPLTGGPSREQLEREVLGPLGARFDALDPGFDEQRSRGRGYYNSLCFEIAAYDGAGVEHSLVDGGFTDWTQQLLSSRKERLLISGIGTERVCSLLETWS